MFKSVSFEPRKNIIFDKILTHQKTFPEMSKPPAIFMPRWGENTLKIKPHPLYIKRKY